MSLLNRFRLLRKKPASANVAKERLQIIISHERSKRDTLDFLPELQQELLAVIRKYVEIDQDQLQMDVEQGDGCSILELNVTLPDAEAQTNNA